MRTALKTTARSSRRSNGSAEWLSRQWVNLLIQSSAVPFFRRLLIRLGGVIRARGRGTDLVIEAQPESHSSLEYTFTVDSVRCSTFGTLSKATSVAAGQSCRSSISG